MNNKIALVLKSLSFEKEDLAGLSLNQLDFIFFFFIFKEVNKINNLLIDHHNSCIGIEMLSAKVKQTSKDYFYLDIRLKVIFCIGSKVSGFLLNGELKNVLFNRIFLKIKNSTLEENIKINIEVKEKISYIKNDFSTAQTAYNKNLKLYNYIYNEYKENYIYKIKDFLPVLKENENNKIINYCSESNKELFYILNIIK